jgi:hypothetical protein
MTPAGSARTIPISPGKARTRAPVAAPVHHALAATLATLTSRRDCPRGSSPMPNKGWQRKFEEPIVLPDGRKLKTLAEAMAWLAKDVPKSEHKMDKVQAAAHLVTRAAEHGGPMIFAQMGMLQAVHRHQKREFNPDRKDTHWGKRRLKRDQ